eukprot:scpid46558/ scgid31663/ 
MFENVSKTGLCGVGKKSHSHCIVACVVIARSSRRLPTVPTVRRKCFVQWCEWNISICERQTTTKSKPNTAVESRDLGMAVSSEQRPAGLTLGHSIAMRYCSRIAYVVCSLVTVGAVALASANGYSPSSGYYCLYGSYHVCNLILALSIILLVSGVLQLVVDVLRIHGGRGIISCEVTCTVLALVSFVLQVSLYEPANTAASRQDQLCKAGMAFTLLVFLLGTLNSFLMSVRDPTTSAVLPAQDSFAGWIRHAASGMLEVPLLSLALVLTLTSLAIVGSFGIESGVMPNSTCLFQVDSEHVQTSACLIPRACNVLTLCTVPLLIMDVWMRAKMAEERGRQLPLLTSVGRTVAIIVVIGMQITASVMAAQSWTSILSSEAVKQLNGMERYGGGAVISCHVLTAMALLMTLGYWTAGLLSRVPDRPRWDDADDEADGIRLGELKPGHGVALLLVELSIVACAAVVMATLSNANYDGKMSAQNHNSSCVYASNEHECNFVLATVAVTLVIQFLLLFTRFDGCFPYDKWWTDLAKLFDAFATVSFFVMWLASSSLQARRMVKNRIDHNRSVLIVAVVFSFFVTALVPIKITVVRRSVSKAISDHARSKGTHLEMIVLLLLLAGSTLSVVLTARDAQWPDQTGRNAVLSNTCILESSSEMCQAMLASYSLSLGISLLLIIFTCLVHKRPAHLLITVIATVPCTVLSWVMACLINAKWHTSAAKSPVFAMSAHQYNAGYALAACSVCIAVCWSVLMLFWSWKACQRFSCLQLIEVCPPAHGSRHPGAASDDAGEASDDNGHGDGGGDGVAAAGAGGGEGREHIPVRFLTRGSWHKGMKWRNKNKKCPVMEDCWNFVVNSLTLNGLRDVFDHRYDRCYCGECIDKTMEKQRIERGNELYLLPSGWCRFGLDPKAMVEQYGGDVSVVNDMFGSKSPGANNLGQPVAYHGTFTTNVRSILHEGRLLRPGERARLSGNVINVGDGHYDDERQPYKTEYFDYRRVFLSPSIRYCECYCQQEPRHSTHMCAMQARVDSSKAKRSRETLAGKVEEKDIGREVMEVSVKDGKHAPLYGLLVRRRGNHSSQ